MRSTRAFACAFLLTAAAAVPATAADTAGFLYGRVTTEAGDTYQGRLRWDDEEAFWGDFFNSAKEDNEWVDLAPRDDREGRKRRIEVFGVEIGSVEKWEDFDHGRQFIARFGDIARIEPRHGDELVVTMKSGKKYELEGGSNDVEAKIRVWDGSLGVVELDWRRIRAIDLMETPALGAVPVRLHGTVKTRSGDFTGFVQWDQEECLGPDELDGETADGDMSIEMGNIRAIERRSSGSSRVTLKDGRAVVLSDTNDVDDSNRGIYVEDPRYGRVLISWDTFERVDFNDGGSGPGYGDYPPGRNLAGTVTTLDGKKLAGRLVYDLDESETTEMLDGERDHVEYAIPFSLVAAVIPRRDASRVVLRSGEELVLEETVDVSEANAGVLVWESGKERPTYVPWDAVDRVDFDAPGSAYPPARR